ncbi:MAG: PQQ-binding-like beta-propeller repeat protein [Pirellulaceae bacterium]
MRIRLLQVCVCLIICLVCKVGIATDWTTYLNGTDRAGYSNAALQPQLNLAWIYRSQAVPELAWSGPRETPIEGHVMRHRVDFDSSMQVVISGNRAFFGSTVDHKLHCLDAQTGQEIWSFYTDGPIRLAPALADGKAYFGSDDGRAYCVDQVDGRLIWSVQVGPRDDRLLSRGEMISRWPVRTGVLVDKGVAYFGAGVFPHESVYLCAVNAETGEPIWRNDTISQQDAGRNDLSPQGYMLCGEDYLYVPSGRSLPVAFSKTTGDIVFQRKYSWRAEAGGVVGGTKALLGDGQVYSGGPHHFLAMDDKTGAVGDSWIGGRQMVLTDDLAYLMDGEKIFCVDRDEHARASQEKQKWFLRTRNLRDDPQKLAEAQEEIKKYAGIGIIWQVASDFDDALIATQSLLIAGGQDQVLVLDRATGQQLWESTVEGNVTGLAATDSLLTVSTNLGHIYCFSTDQNIKEPKYWPPESQRPFADAVHSEFYRTAAAEILEKSGQTTGFCLVVGNEDGQLAYELASQSALTIIAVEEDALRATAARETLEKAGIHGSRITIVNAEYDKIPFSNYFANLIVSDSQLRHGPMPCRAESIARFLKPCGGVAMLHSESGISDSKQSDDSTWMFDLLRMDEGETIRDARWQVFRRGKLPGAGAWSHQYGNAANTSVSDDQLVRDGLGVLWYGDPGPSSMINRHEAAGAPLSTNGRMFIQGVDSVMAYDAYNGNFLWEYENPGAQRTGVFNNRETHNLAAAEDVLYVAVNDKCLGLDAATGQVVSQFQNPKSEDGIDRAWAYLAYDDGLVFGSSTIREELEQRLRRRGLTVKSQTDAVFAVDVENGQRLWTYRGSNILHTTIAIGPEHIYFIDSSITPEERQELYRRDKGKLKALTGEAAKQAEEEMKALDVRLAVALDKRTGEKLWEQPVNVTDTTDVSAGGGSLTVMYADGYLVLCGANANGHYWKQFLAGEFETRKLLVLDAKSGEELWSKNANYMNRPAIINGDVYAEPWAFKLATGEPKTRLHPVTGQESTWRFSRPGHHCGVITATPNMMFFRSGFIGYYDLYRDSGTKHFSGQRLGCWVNAIPGNGLVMIPEASAGCVCQFSIASTVVLEPKRESQSWAILSAVGDETPVKRMGINLGAPGDRLDNARQEWFGYPRPTIAGRLEYVFDISPQIAEGGGWFNTNENVSPHADSDAPWLYSSGARGLEHFELKLRGESDKPAEYIIKLFFANVDQAQLARIKVKLQGVETDGEIKTGTANGSALIKEFRATVKDILKVDLNDAASRTIPELCAVEVLLVE